MLDGLLRTKIFHPPPRPSQVIREPLWDRFSQARQCGITCALVSAPAGFGKTTLVADCVRASGQPFAWLALDEGDNVSVTSPVGQFIFPLEPGFRASQTLILPPVNHFNLNFRL